MISNRAGPVDRGATGPTADRSRLRSVAYERQRSQLLSRCAAAWAARPTGPL